MLLLYLILRTNQGFKEIVQFHELNSRTYLLFRRFQI